MTPKTSKKKSSQDLENSLNTIKKKIIDLIASYLTNKFIKNFKEKGYSEKNLKTDLDFLITEKDIRNFKYGDAINGIEMSILEKVNQMPVKITTKVIKEEFNPKTLKTEEEKISSTKKISNKFQINSQNLKISEISQSESPYNSNLLNKLHQKENDEWAQMVKNNHKNFLQQEKEKFQRNLDLKKSTKEFYEIQMYEKEFKKKLENDDLNKFVKLRDDNLKKIKETEKKISEEAKEKVKSQKELKIKMLNEFYDIKKSNQFKEGNEQKEYLDYINLKKKEDEEIKLRKKEIVKDLYQNVFQQIENNLEKKKIEKEKEKFENWKKLEEYSKILEQRDNERYKTIYNMLKKFEKKCEIEENPEFKFEDREDLKNKLAEKRFREQSVEKEQITRKEEENRKLNKMKDKLDMKSFLEFQMNEKKTKMAELKMEDKNYLNEIKKSLENYENEEKLNELKKQEELMKYKQGLDSQIKEKVSLNANWISKIKT